MYEPPITWSPPFLTPKLPRAIRIHYVPLNPNTPNCCQYKAESLSTPLPTNTPYTIKGVWGCSPNRQTPISQAMRVHITIDNWFDYVVAGKDLLP